MSVRDEWYDGVCGFIYVLKATAIGLVALTAVAIKGAYDDVQAEEALKKQIENDDEAFPYSAVNCNGKPIIVDTGDYGMLMLDKNEKVLVMDSEGNSYVVNKNDVEVLNKFETYEDAQAYVMEMQGSMEKTEASPALGR